LSILELDRPFLAANRVNFEDAEWWTAEDMVKRWILATKLVGKVLAVMQTQLMAQECGTFDRFKDDYFMAIAKQSILVLLKFADGFTSTRSPEKLIYVLELYGALGSSAPGLLPLFTGKLGELISRQVPVVLAKLERNLEEKSALACSCRKSKPPNGCRPLSHQRAPSTCSWLAYDILPFRFRGKSHTLGMTEERYKTPPGPASAGRDIC